MPSVFDQPPAGVMKGNGQMAPTGMGAYNAPQQGAPQPLAPPAGDPNANAPPQAGGPAASAPGADPGMISSLIAALAKAFAPKSITDRGKNIEKGIAQGEGKEDSLGGQF